MPAAGSDPGERAAGAAAAAIPPIFIFKMASSSALPELGETFPADKYPLREIGQGFTAQACRGEEAEACALIAAEMLLESRTFEVSACASVSSETSLDGAGENFTVADLPLPEGAAKVSRMGCCFHYYCFAGRSVYLSGLSCALLRAWVGLPSLVLVIKKSPRAGESAKNLLCPRSCVLCYSSCGRRAVRVSLVRLAGQARRVLAACIVCGANASPQRTQTCGTSHERPA